MLVVEESLKKHRKREPIEQRSPVINYVFCQFKFRSDNFKWMGSRWFSNQIDMIVNCLSQSTQTHFRGIGSWALYPESGSEVTETVLRPSGEELRHTRYTGLNCFRRLLPSFAGPLVRPKVKVR